MDLPFAQFGQEAPKHFRDVLHGCVCRFAFPCAGKKCLLHVLFLMSLGQRVACLLHPPACVQRLSVLCCRFFSWHFPSR